jgi:hypothetical protein
MPFLSEVPPPIAAALDEIASLLEQARELLIEIAESRRWEPAVGSQAEADFATAIFPDDVNEHLLKQPRAISSLYLRDGSEHLAGIAALFRAREVFVAPNALARVALEHGVRAVLVLDERATARQRSARAMLDDLASAYHSRLTVSHLGARTTPSFQEVDRRWSWLRTTARKSFSEVNLADDPFRWSIDGERYLRITDAVEAWCEWRSDSLPGEGVYDALSLYTHPQTFAAREEVAADPKSGELRLETKLSTLTRVAIGALATWVDGMSLLCQYHGWHIWELDGFADVAAGLLERFAS